MFFPHIQYFSLYITVDTFMQKIYLPYFNAGPNYIKDIPILSSVLYSTSFFMVILYLYLLFHRKFIGKTNDDTGVLLSFIYSNYILTILMDTYSTVEQHEMRRLVMWSFTTPLMLKSYADINNLTIWDIKIHWHLAAIVPYMFILPYKGTNIYLVSSSILSIPCIGFIYNLFKIRHYSFTGLYICIWSIFLTIHTLKLICIIDDPFSQCLFNLSDTFSKYVSAIVISNYNQQIEYRRNSIDIQTAHFISYMVNSINDYKEININITPICAKMIEYIKQKFVQSLPENSINLKMDLLRKLLPFGLDSYYINTLYTKNSLDSSIYYENVCVLLMDIVSYSELCKMNGDSDIFKLLDDIYKKLDIVIKKYKSLQKIETIGDAYMVVGDLSKKNNINTVVNEIVKLSCDFISTLQHIKLNEASISIRIGISIGHVTVGILGNEHPKLCIVGDTVNMASRIQGYADPDTVYVSEGIYNIAKETFSFEPYTNVSLKNVGCYTLYRLIN